MWCYPWCKATSRSEPRLSKQKNTNIAIGKLKEQEEDEVEQRKNKRTKKIITMIKSEPLCQTQLVTRRRTTACT